jgi:TonB family protein
MLFSGDAMIQRSGFYSQKFYFVFLVAMLFLHLGLLILKLQESQTKVSDEGQRMRIEIVNDAEKKQIVQSEDSSQNKKQDDAFLSDKTRSFERETKSRRTDLFEKSARGENSSSVSESRRTTPKKKTTSQDIKLSDLGTQSVEGHPYEKAAREYGQAKKGLKNGDPHSTTLSATNDHLEELPLSDFTHLNTTEYKYYGFYHRIRQKLEQFWGRSIYEKAQQMVKEGRRLPAGQEVVTALEITLNSQGKVLSIRIMGTSGVKELDEAAVESFNQAGPFPNPPQDLIVEGKVKIEWGFVVKS